MIFLRRERIAGREHVAGVDAHGHAIRILDPLDYLRQVLEAMAQRRALPGSVLQERLHFELGRLPMDFVERRDYLRDPASSLVLVYAPGWATT